MRAVAHATVSACLIWSASLLGQQGQATGAFGPISPWFGVDQTLHRVGDRVPDGALFVDLPRDDVEVWVGDVPLSPEFGLSSHALFLPRAGLSEVLVELVVLNEELPGVLARATATLLELADVHAHVPGARPALSAVHLRGQGNSNDLARAIRDVAPEPILNSRVNVTDGRPFPFDPALIRATPTPVGKFGHEIFRLLFPRPDAPTIGRAGTLHSSATASLIRLSRRPNGAIAALGTLVVNQTALSTVVAALTRGGLSITAIHRRAGDEGLVDVHVWGQVPEPDAIASLKLALAAG
jgi:Domain of Unknown Function (DUF1259)